MNALRENEWHATLAHCGHEAEDDLGCADRVGRATQFQSSFPYPLFQPQRDDGRGVAHAVFGQLPTEPLERTALAQ